MSINLKDLVRGRKRNVSEKKILILDQSGALGGAELSLLEICKRIRRSCEVVLFADGPFRKSLTDAGVTVNLSQQHAFQNMRKQGGRTLSIAAITGTLRLTWKIIRLARARRIIYANTQKAMVIGALAGLIARRPVVWHLRDIVTSEHFDKHRLAIIKFLSKHMITHVIANSRASADALQALADLPPDRVSVVYNGIDVLPFTLAANIPASALRARYGLPPDAYLIGTFSRLAHWKGQHVLLDALVSLPDAHAVLVGAALFGEDAYEAKLRAQVQALGLSERVHFLGFQSDIAGLMHAMDVIVHTSIAPEPFGRVIVEAMLAHRPVIAAAGGGALEIITDGVDGVLVSPGDHAALAAAVEHLRHRPAERDAIVLRGYSRARGSFDPDAYCKAVLRKLELVGQFALPMDNGEEGTIHAARSAIRP